MPTTQQKPRGRSKRGKKRPRPPANDEYIKVVPLRIEDDILEPVQISKGRRAKNCKVSPDGCKFSSAAGYRSVQSNRGTFCGTWFFEIHVVHLGATGHARLGIGTVKQEIDAPCGYTEASYGYRDVDGSKVTKGWRDPYAEPYREGDTVGVYLHLPEGGNPNEPKTEIVRWKGKLFQTDDAPFQPAKPLPGSILGYSVNGKWQGPAYTDILEGTYYAAASLFTKPRPDKMASVIFNFGPDFKFGPPGVEGLPPARPFCEVPPKPPPVPDEDGTVTVDKTIMAVVHAPGEEAEDPSQQQQHRTSVEPGGTSALASAPANTVDLAAMVAPAAVDALVAGAEPSRVAGPQERAAPPTDTEGVAAAAEGAPGQATIGGVQGGRVAVNSVAAVPRRRSLADGGGGSAPGDMVMPG